MPKECSALDLTVEVSGSKVAKRGKKRKLKTLKAQIGHCEKIDRASVNASSGPEAGRAIQAFSPK